MESPSQSCVRRVTIYAFPLTTAPSNAETSVSISSGALKPSVLHINGFGAEHCDRGDGSLPCDFVSCNEIKTVLWLIELNHQLVSISDFGLNISFKTGNFPTCEVSVKRAHDEYKIE